MSVREIKFRGKTITTGEWVYGYYVKARELHYILPFYNKDNFDERYHLEGTDEFGWYEVDPKTVGQFTGLLDKNGKEVYEADLLKRLNGEVETVVFDSGCFCIKHKDGSFDFIAEHNQFEIVGNIYENIK